MIARAATSTSDSNDTTFVSVLPNTTAGITSSGEVALGVAKMLFGGFSLLSGAAVAITTGGDGDVLDKSAEIIADGAYDVGRNTWIQNNSAWKAQPPADWNINVDYEAGQVTGGGMSPFTPVPPPPTPHRPFP